MRTIVGFIKFISFILFQVFIIVGAPLFMLTFVLMEESEIENLTRNFQIFIATELNFWDYF